MFLRPKTATGALTVSQQDQWRIQDFPEEEALTPKGGGTNLNLANFSRKLHENEEILDQRGASPLRSATEDDQSLIILGLFSEFTNIVVCLTHNVIQV